MERFLDHSDAPKTRAAVLSAAIFKMVLANLTLATDRIALLGLEVIVQQDRLVAMGRIVTSVLLGLFVLRSVPGLIEAWRLLRIARLEHSEARARTEVIETFGLDAPGPPEYGPHAEIDEIESNHAHLRWQTERRVETLNFRFGIALSLSIDLLFPAAVALTAIFYPEAIAHQIDRMVEARPAHHPVP